MNTVFLLGAGASKHAGAPVMSDFLEQSKNLLLRNVIDEVDQSAFKTVFNIIGKLQSVHSKSKLDLHNIESIFTVFELGSVIGRLAGANLEEIEAGKIALQRLIVTTIERTMAFPLNDNAAIMPTNIYSDFIELIKKLRDDADPKHKVSIITFNYDLGVDVALARHGFTPDYQLTFDSQDINSGRIKFLKLHGSLNWVKSKDGDIKFMDINKYISTSTLTGYYNQKSCHIQMSKHLQFQIEGKKEEPNEITPLIIPPSWNKSDYHKSVTKVWSAAAQVLSEADNLFIMGYSLPETDSFFKHLYALGTLGDNPFRHLGVFDPSQAVDDRFRNLLGPGAIQKYHFYPLTFEKGISEIKNMFIKNRR